MACAAIAATIAETGGEAVAGDALATGVGEAVAGDAVLDTGATALGSEFGTDAAFASAAEEGGTTALGSEFGTDAAFADAANGAATGATDGLAGDSLSKATLDGTNAFGANSVGGAFDLAGAVSPWQSAMNSLGLDNFGMKDAMKLAGPAMSMGSSLIGMQRAAQLRKQAQLAALRADPFGTSGGRAFADAQMQELMRNPGGVAASDPSYALRIQGAQRANAQYGQDSGAMSVAGANASTSWYNDRMQQLGGLAGASFNPAYGSMIGIQGQEAAAGIESSSLASAGYGVTRATGGGTGAMTPEQQQALIQMYLKSKG